MKKLVIVLYSVFLSLFTVFSYAFVDPNLSYLKNLYSDFAFSNRLLTTIFYSLAIFIFFVFYGIFIYLGIRKKINLKEVFTLLGITIVILFFSYPAMLSYDIFNYVATSKVFFFYKENPYVVMPIEFTGDPLLAFTHAANKIALYGPFWLVLTGIPYFLGFGNFIINLFGLKFIAGIFYLFTAIFVWKTSKNVMSLILFALNPLIVIETLVSGHNDVVMVFLALFSFYLLVKKKIMLGILFFVLSVFVKYATIVLVPLLLIIIWRSIKNKEIDWKKVYFFSSVLMLIAFLLSPIREEIYPWYVIWFVSFAFLVPDKRLLLYVSIAFSFGLLLRYIPYMLTGTYAEKTPFVKEIVSFAPLVLVFAYYALKKKI